MYDVIIIGGGISGTMAAVGAARNGAKTLVVEDYGFLGGMLTAAGVGPMMTFHAGDKQVIRGVTGELIDRLVVKGKSPGHIYDTIRFSYTVTPFDVEAMKRELEIMVTECGGEILYHTKLAGVAVVDGELKEITVCNKSGLTKLLAKVFVDATGDADLAAWAGVNCTKGRKLDGATQPMTMKLRIVDVDIDAVKRYIRENVEEFPVLHGDPTIIDRAPRLSIGGFEKLWKDAQKSGKISIHRNDLLLFEAHNPGEVIINSTRILGHDSTDPWSLSKAEMEGRKQAEELFGFLKENIPGFEKSILLYTGPSIGVRSSRQIVGLYTLTAEDLVTCRKFDDVIAHSGYPIDIHSPDGAGLQHVKLKWGDTYGIPYRCLVNSEVKNIVTVGRCISAEFEAQAAIRTTPTVGAIGHAGGVAASVAAKGEGDARAFDVREIQKILLKQGAYLEI